MVRSSPVPGTIPSELILMTESKSAKSSIRVETVDKTPILETIEVEIEAPRVRKAFERAMQTPTE